MSTTTGQDRELMEDSIQVFKIYKLLQRMKNKVIQYIFLRMLSNDLPFFLHDLT